MRYSCLLLVAALFVSCSSPHEPQPAPLGGEPASSPAPSTPGNAPEAPEDAESDPVAAVESNADEAAEELPEVEPDGMINEPRPRALIRRSMRAVADAMGRDDLDAAVRMLTSSSLMESLDQLKDEEDYDDYVRARMLLLDFVRSYRALGESDPWASNVRELREEVAATLGVRHLHVDPGLADIDDRARTIQAFDRVLLYVELGQFADVGAELQGIFRRLRTLRADRAFVVKARRAAQAVADEVMRITAKPDPEETAEEPETDAAPSDQDESSGADEAESDAVSEG